MGKQYHLYSDKIPIVFLLIQRIRYTTITFYQQDALYIHSYKNIKEKDEKKTLEIFKFLFLPSVDLRFCNKDFERKFHSMTEFDKILTKCEENLEKLGTNRQLRS